MTDKVQTVRAALQEARSGLDNLLSNEEMLRKVVEAADLMVASMKQNGKVMSCGNGGSLCDAMHFAEEHLLLCLCLLQNEKRHLRINNR